MKHLNYFLIIIILIGLACTKAEKKSEEKTQEEQPELTEEPTKTYLEIDVIELESIEAGDEIRLELIESEMYTLIIQRAEETMQGIVSISAIVNNEETGQANLIFREGKLSGQMTMHTKGIMYNLGFDENEQLHFISPIDPEERDILPGGEPREVPRNDG